MSQRRPFWTKSTQNQAYFLKSGPFHTLKRFRLSLSSNRSNPSQCPPLCQNSPPTSDSATLGIWRFLSLASRLKKNSKQLESSASVQADWVPRSPSTSQPPESAPSALSIQIAWNSPTYNAKSSSAPKTRDAPNSKPPPTASSDFIPPSPSTSTPIPSPPQTPGGSRPATT